MTFPMRKTRDPIESFSYSAIAELRRYKTPYWPNDCPDCGCRMEFGFEPTVRKCTCGREVTELEALERK